MAGANGNFPASLSVLDVKNDWDRWHTQMEEILGFQEIAAAKTSKEARDILNKSYDGVEYKDLEAMKIDELHGSLEAHEMRLNLRDTERDTEKAFYARGNSNKKNWNDKGKSFKGKSWKGKDIGQSSSHEEDTDSKRKWESKEKGQDKEKVKKRKSKKKDVQCYACKKLGHYSYECKRKKKGSKPSDSSIPSVEVINSVVSTHKNDDSTWYLDSGCSSHMTSHKDWFVDLDENRTSSVKFADNSMSTATGKGRVLIRKKNGKQTLIHDLLFVPSVKHNLISLRQLIEKGYFMKTKGVRPK
ncbi:uncharacterized protein LOC130719274 [Lotus japonicus]|uniref:uncharacterized protein LOC130719274 n=1 Tax=Lotus japonicus TaxID=34305 RepID=UPI0025882FB8|nr:uncharacterized protein LOC130719274 [Lotus japonicus]